MKAEILSKNAGISRILQKTTKTLQKGIDKPTEVWYNLRVAAREGVREAKESEGAKKPQKSFKNHLTNSFECDIIKRSLRSSESKGFKKT